MPLDIHIGPSFKVGAAAHDLAGRVWVWRMGDHYTLQAGPFDSMDEARAWLSKVIARPDAAQAWNIWPEAGHAN
jgi:hypothetical protein